MRDERIAKDELLRLLRGDFEVFEEATVSHALFRHRVIRPDMLAIPVDERMSDIALAFEVKGDTDWDVPRLSAALKQASDYVLATVVPGGPWDAHAGKRVMATFLYPAPSKMFSPDLAADEAYRRGMVHMAGYFRVGAAFASDRYGGRPLALECPGEVWVKGRGWRADARNILVGKRQIGSQRFSVLDELKRI